MGFVTSSDPLLQVALWATLSSAAASLFGLMLIAWLRIRLIQKIRRQRRLFEQWRPLLAWATIECPATLPKLAPVDRVAFLHLWVHYHASLRGAVKRNLNELARRLNVGRMAERLLRRPALGARLLAVTVLGDLQDESAWPKLAPLLRHRNPVLSLTAARALVQIDAQAAAPEILRIAPLRSDWAVAHVARILKEVRRDALEPHLFAALKEASGQAELRLLGIIEMVEPEHCGPVVRAILARAREPELIAACLRALRSPDDLALIRPLTGHPHWFVRLHAIQVLSRLAMVEDLGRLIALMADREWWVRLRAAEAVVALPFLSRKHLEALRQRLSSRDARDMLDHALAEQEMERAA